MGRQRWGLGIGCHWLRGEVGGVLFNWQAFEQDRMDWIFNEINNDKKTQVLNMDRERE